MIIQTEPKKTELKVWQRKAFCIHAPVNKYKKKNIQMAGWSLLTFPVTTNLPNQVIVSLCINILALLIEIGDRDKFSEDSLNY